MKLVHFGMGIRHSSDVNWMDVIKDWQWELIQKAIKEEWTLYIGEVDVEFQLQHDDIKLLSEDEAEIALFHKWFPRGMGRSLMWAIEGYLDCMPEEEFNSLMKELGNPEEYQQY